MDKRSLRDDPMESRTREEEAFWNTFGYIAKIGVGIGIGVSTLVGLVTSCYTVPQESQAVVTRFGKYTETTEPGLHGKMPFGIDRATKVPVRKVQKIEFGFRTAKSGIDSQFIGVDTPGIDGNLAETIREEYLTLTGDLNMADIEWVCQYKIKDPVAYLFNVREAEETIRDANLDVMKRIAGDGSIDELLILNRREYELEAQQEVQRLLDGYNIGVQVVAVNLQSTNPPLNVRPSFNNVSIAMQTRETMINDARKKRNEIIPKATGEAEQTIKQAEAYAVERVNKAKGDADRFNQILVEYDKSPDITRRRLHLETIGMVLGQIGDKTIIEQRGAEGGVLLKLDIDRTPEPVQNNPEVNIGGNVK